MTSGQGHCPPERHPRLLLAPGPAGRPGRGRSGRGCPAGSSARWRTRSPGRRRRPPSGGSVLIDVRPVAKLTGPDPVDVAAALAPVFTALSSAALDLATLRVVCDWIQYRHNFYEPVEVRPVLADRPQRAEPGGEQARPAESGLEIAIDMRRCSDGDLAARVTRALAGQARQDGAGHVLLEPWQP